jgi:uncharacterized membrane protein YqgA involved in biofilm formation
VKIFFQVMGIFTLFLGISMALKSTHVLHMVMALILGSLIGEALNLQLLMERFGDQVKRKIKIGNEYAPRADYDINFALAYPRC